MRVYDGKDRSISVAKLTGDNIQPPIYINNNQAIVDMTTDRSLAYKGFEASYTAG